MEAAIIAGILLLLGTVYYCTKPKTPIPGVYKHKPAIGWSNEEKELSELVNNFRIQNNLNRLVEDDLCYILALVRLDEIMDDYHHYKDIFHNVELLTEEIQDNGGSIGRENLAEGFSTIETCFKAWINSEDHLDNMLSDWKYTGVAVGMDHTGRRFYVQVFGK